MIRRGKGIPPTLAVPVAALARMGARAVRSAWRRLVSAMPVSPMVVLVIVNVLALVLVSVIMFRVVRVLHQAACVIGAEEGLTQCLK